MMSFIFLIIASTFITHKSIGFVHSGVRENFKNDYLPLNGEYRFFGKAHSTNGFKTRNGYKSDQIFENPLQISTNEINKQNPVEDYNRNIQFSRNLENQAYAVDENFDENFENADHFITTTELITTTPYLPNDLNLSKNDLVLFISVIFKLFESLCYEIPRKYHRLYPNARSMIEDNIRYSPLGQDQNGENKMNSFPLIAQLMTCTSEFSTSTTYPTYYVLRHPAPPSTEPPFNLEEFNAAVKEYYKTTTPTPLPTKVNLIKFLEEILRKIKSSCNNIGDLRNLEEIEKMLAPVIEINKGLYEFRGQSENQSEVDTLINQIKLCFPRKSV